MRAIFTAVFSGVMFLSMAGIEPAYAAANVLLPDSYNNNNSSGTLPNLGLTPQAPAPDASMTTAPATTPTPPLPDTTGASPDAMPAIPKPTLPVYPSTPPSPHVLQVPDMGPMQNFNDPSLKNGMSVAISNKSVWGYKDVSAINQRLGIPTDKVSSTCHMALSGFLKTDKGAYLFDTGAAMSTTVRYNGNVTAVMMSAKALCDQMPMTPSQGFILQVGNKYSLPLEGVACANVPQTPQSLTVTFPANGDPQCSIQ